MIKHIVILRLKEENKTENSKIIKEKLEGLLEVISVIKKLQVNPSISNKYTNCDIVLECEFENMDDLEIYQTHPEHLKVLDFIKRVAEQRFCVEYIF